MAFTPVEGAATTGAAPVLPPALATWAVDVAAKTSTASILGGTAVISRSPKDNKFRCQYDKKPIAPEGTEGAEGGISMSVPLHDSPNLVVAQHRAEALIRESLHKTHPDLYSVAVGHEQTALVGSAPPDPF